MANFVETVKFGRGSLTSVNPDDVTTMRPPSLRAENDGLMLHNKALVERNKELNNQLDDVWNMYRNHYGECPSLRDNIVATIFRFILRHT